jgi:predicted membrane-bound spermidine synthase
MASFGVTTALVSIVISMFMAGLGLGSWGAGVWTRRAKTSRTALRLYALAELLVGISSIVVPYELRLGRLLLQNLGNFAVWQSSRYYLVAGGWIALTLVPWCTCMGSTFPLLMTVIRQTAGPKSERSFSYLYIANVAGALAGTFTSAFVLIELLGFTGTLHVAGVLNATLVVAAMVVAARLSGFSLQRSMQQSARQKLYGIPDAIVLCFLFTTGMVGMGMEVVWIREFTPYLGNVVYTFAGILAVYLLATVVGSQDYRSWVFSHKLSDSIPAWSSLALFAVIPVVAADPLLPLRVGGVELGGLRLSAIVLFCALAGFLTPLLVDAWSGGDASRAGTAYALNVVGCIVGPLIAGFLLLPRLGERRSLVVLATPLFAIAAFTAFRRQPSAEGGPRPRLNPKMKFVAAAIAAGLLFRVSHDYETKFPERVVRRDYTATVIATGTGFEKQLLVNGFGMTMLTPVTKYMAHLPLAFMPKPAQSGLVICFGMGTTFRSMLSWGIRTTAVDLVPSVPALFGYYHSDASRVLSNPLGRVVVDDGRRFLDGTNETYDVIVVDPPPPPAAAGSSLLYSVEFYEVIKKHLRKGGILQMWYPAGEGDDATAAAVAKAIQQSFPYVRAFMSFDRFGFHFLASMQPLPETPSSVLASRMPSAAVPDFLEWGPESTVESQFERVVSQERTMQQIVDRDPKIQAIRDDEPVNEYYLLRGWFHLDR